MGYWVYQVIYMIKISVGRSTWWDIINKLNLNAFTEKKIFYFLPREKMLITFNIGSKKITKQENANELIKLFYCRSKKCLTYDSIDLFMLILPIARTLINVKNLNLTHWLLNFIFRFRTRKISYSAWVFGMIIYLFMLILSIIFFCVCDE